MIHFVEQLGYIKWKYSFIYIYSFNKGKVSILVSDDFHASLKHMNFGYVQVAFY